jgi:hypothetical protein
MKTETDIDRYIKDRFGEHAVLAASLIEEHVEKHPDHSGRVVRCVLYLADGSLDELADMLEAASRDYRDVIFWAEYTDYTAQEPRRIRNFSMPFGSENLC